MLGLFEELEGLSGGARARFGEAGQLQQGNGLPVDSSGCFVRQARPGRPGFSGLEVADELMKAAKGAVHILVAPLQRLPGCLDLLA